MSRFFSLICCVIVSAALIGCSGAGDKDKNKNKDVPKPAESAPGK